MNPATILGWALAWSALGGGALLLTSYLTRLSPQATARHFAWVGGFACAAVLPFLAIAGFWFAEKAQPTGTPFCSALPAVDPVRERLFWLALGIWIAGTASILLRTSLAVRSVKRWNRQSVRFGLPEGLHFAWPRRVQVRIARGNFPRVPITFGFWRPVILLPREAQGWDKVRLTAILWHELGHALRGDNLVQLIALGMCALHWFNPIFWFAARRMELEAEMAADAFAISRGVLASDYAAELLALASEVQLEATGFPFAHTAIVNRTSLEDRLRSILAPRTSQRPVTAWTCARIVAAFAALGVILVCVTPLAGYWIRHLPSEPPPGCLPAESAIRQSTP